MKFWTLNVHKILWHKHETQLSEVQFLGRLDVLLMTPYKMIIKLKQKLNEKLKAILLFNDVLKSN